MGEKLLADVMCLVTQPYLEKVANTCSISSPNVAAAPFLQCPEHKTCLIKNIDIEFQISRNNIAVLPGISTH